MENKQKPLILIVDDYPPNLQILGNILLEKNYRITLAENGVEAFNVACKEQPDLILLDVMMPEMDGFETCLELKKTEVTKNIPVIFITALQDKFDEAWALQMGAVDYITKPISAPIVQARVKTYLSLHCQKRALEILVEEKTVELKEKNEEVKATRIEIIRRLGRLAEYKDNETGDHILRMGKMCGILARALGHSEEEVSLIELASPMHDIGKVATPDRILLKPGKLDAEEWTEMKKHAEIGATILSGHDSKLLQTSQEVALTHHEKWDGSGYPMGLKGKNIPISGRICAIADVFDALTSKRPYKEAWPIEEAVLEIQKNMGTHFDPKLVEAFCGVLDEFIEIKQKHTG